VSNDPIRYNWKGLVLCDEIIGIWAPWKEVKIIKT